MSSVTVIICTYNRAVSLERAIRSLIVSAKGAAVDWTLLVVDNNSTDATRATVESFLPALPGRIQYVREEKQGISHARNAGVRAAATPLIAFTDDDVLVQTGWLEELIAPFADARVAAVGGPITPLWETEPPNWISGTGRYALAPLAMFEPEPVDGYLYEPPFGANVAFRRELFARYGLFRTDLGRIGASLISNEDTEFCQRILAGGERIRYAPAAVIGHPVQAERLCRSYFVRWWFAKARSDVRQSGPPTDAGRLVGGVPVRLFFRLARWCAQWTVTVRPARRFACRVRIASLTGTIRESYSLARALRSL